MTQILEAFLHMLLAIAITVLLRGLIGLAGRLKMRKWPVADGEILNAPGDGTLRIGYEINGETLETTARVTGEDPWASHEGAHVPLRCDPKRPERCIVESEQVPWSTIKANLIAGALGCAILVGALVVL